MRNQIHFSVQLYFKDSEKIVRTCIRLSALFFQAVCVARCAGKHIKVNKKVMEIYMEVQPQITKKRMEEMAALQESLEKQNKSSEDTQQTDTRKS
jgi:hypothetical protein